MELLQETGGRHGMALKVYLQEFSPDFQIWQGLRLIQLLVDLMESWEQ